MPFDAAFHSETTAAHRVRSVLVLTLAAAILLVFAAEGRAGVYQYKDEKGVVHITDQPVGENSQLLLTDEKRPRGFIEPADTGWEQQAGIEGSASDYSIPPALLLAMVKTESNFNPKAVSPKGAMGLMQLMPDTAALLGVTDPFDPVQNVRAGTAYFKEQLERFKDIDLALAAYNAGPAAVEKHHGPPPFEETRRYVSKVNWYYRYFLEQKELLELPGLARVLESGNEDLRTGRVDSAEGKYQRVAEAYPRSPEAHYNLALVRERRGDWPGAAAEYKKAVSLDPYFKEAYYNLAILYEKIGKNKRAVNTWKKYLRYEVNLDERREINRYVRELLALDRRAAGSGQ